MEQTDGSIQQTTAPPTKREKRLLKKQEEAQEKQRQRNRLKIKKVATVLLPLLLIGGGLVFALIKYSQSRPTPTATGVDAPKIEIDPIEYDAGTISMAGGLIKKIYKIKNNGASDLTINEIVTSCHCTTAILRVGDAKSPEFGMDGATFWSQKIAPGQSGDLEVIFDPAFHGPQGIGPAVRIITISSNDPQNKKTEIKFIANVTP